MPVCFVTLICTGNKQLDNLSDDELYEYLKKIDSAFAEQVTLIDLLYL